MDSGVSPDPCVLKIELVTDMPTFARLGVEWDGLLNDSAQQSFFLRHSWIQAWWQNCAPPGSRLHVVCCWDSNGKLVGAAPLYWRCHRLLGIPCTRELTFIGMGIELKTSEYLDIVARRGYERAVAEHMTAWLRTSDGWDRLWLHQVPSCSTILPNVIDRLGKGATTSPCDRAPYIDTSVTWEQYKQRLGRSMRRNVEYYARRLFQTYRCEFRCAASVDEALEALDALVDLHQARWRASGQPGSFSDAKLRLLLAETVRHEFAAGRVRIWVLRIEGVIEAALIGFLDNGVLHYFQKGFNPAFSKDDLGTAFLSLCVRASFEDPKIAAFDFMGGDATYKHLWAREIRETNTFEINRPNWRGRLHSARTQLRHVTTAAFRAIMPNFIRAARRDFLHTMRMRRYARRGKGGSVQLQLLVLAMHTAEIRVAFGMLF